MSTRAIEARVDPTELSEEERVGLGKLVGSIKGDQESIVIGGEGCVLPKLVATFFAAVLRSLAEGQSVLAIEEQATLTTAAAADFLGMSRQYFVKLLQRGELPFHLVGAHRRVTFSHLMAYRRKRDQARRAVLDKAFEELDSLGVYDRSADYTGEGTVG